MLNVTDRIHAFNKGLPDNMIKLKYRAMLENPFRFFRGTCHLFYEDLSKVNEFPDSPTGWLCGDLHLENFGSFKANNRMVYFDLNDFDESILGPVLWEVSRVLTSIYVALDLLKIKEKSIQEIARLFLISYCDTLKSGKSRYIDPRTATGLVRSFLKSASLLDEKYLLDKATYLKDGKYLIKINNQTHFKLDKELREDLILQIKNWITKSKLLVSEYKVLDVVYRVAGTGSIGLNRYMFLLQNKATRKKFLFIEMKSEMTSSLSPYIRIKQPEWPSEGERVILVKYRMQNVPPALLSSLIFKNQDYVVQEMQPAASKINFEIMPGNKAEIVHILQDMAILTASAQLRSSGIQGSAINDELSVFGNKTDWQEYLLNYASKYAKQVKKDFKSFRLKHKDRLTSV
jgi:uncharacterized protein (DUF2252 family)